MLRCKNMRNQIWLKFRKWTCLDGWKPRLKMKTKNRLTKILQKMSQQQKSRLRIWISISLSKEIKRLCKVLKLLSLDLPKLCHLERQLRLKKELPHPKLVFNHLIPQSLNWKRAANSKMKSQQKETKIEMKMVKKMILRWKTHWCLLKTKTWPREPNWQWHLMMALQSKSFRTEIVSKKLSTKRKWVKITPREITLSKIKLLIVK